MPIIYIKCIENNNPNKVLYYYYLMTNIYNLCNYVLITIIIINMRSIILLYNYYIRLNLLFNYKFK